MCYTGVERVPTTAIMLNGGGIETCVAALGLLLYIQIQIAPYIKIIRVLGFRQPLFNQVFVHHHHLQIRFVQKSMMK